MKSKIYFRFPQIPVKSKIKQPQQQTTLIVIIKNSENASKKKKRFIISISCSR